MPYISFHHEAEYLRGVEASAMQGEVICVGGSLLALWTRLTIAKIMPEGGWRSKIVCSKPAEPHSAQF